MRRASPSAARTRPGRSRGHVAADPAPPGAAVDATFDRDRARAHVTAAQVPRPAGQSCIAVVSALEDEAALPRLVTRDGDPRPPTDAERAPKLGLILVVEG